MSGYANNDVLNTRSRQSLIAKKAIKPVIENASTRNARIQRISCVVSRVGLRLRIDKCLHNHLLSRYIKEKLSTCSSQEAFFMGTASCHHTRPSSLEKPAW